MSERYYSLGLSRSSFTAMEAECKLGHRVRLTVDLGRVPAETWGKVVGLMRSQVLGICVDVEWLMPGDRHDAFSKREYDAFLIEETEQSPAA
jgi:hypothetical protein